MKELRSSELSSILSIEAEGDGRLIGFPEEAVAWRFALF
jgi:hypothetical protein